MKEKPTKWKRFATVFSVVAVLAVGATQSCGGGTTAHSTAMPENALAPAFVLPDHTGKKVSLEKLLERGPVVVVFYRGFW
jgi:cytochrome oxidase Cu insertion factor (SCO1/SenC/PrrC family)